MSQNEPEFSDQVGIASQFEDSRLARFRASLSISVILLMLLFTPAWAGLLAWLGYEALITLVGLASR